MHNKSFFKFLLFLATIPVFNSCDKEYSTVGESLFGENNFELTSDTFNVVAYNKEITAVQSDNLPVNALGIYDNPAFGKTTASFVTQLTLATLNPTIGQNPVVESVYLDVPYFFDASQTVPLSTGGNTYVLDSIYGEPTAKIKLSIYESGLDMDNQDAIPQLFYTNQNADFDEAKIEHDPGQRLNNALDVAQNDAFFFDPTQHSETTNDANGNPITSYSPPSMRLQLNAGFFQDKIFDNAPIGSLSNQNVFDKHFRGLYFKVEQSGADKGCMAMINFKKGTITIKYKEDSSTTPITRVEKTLILNMSSGFTASLLENSNTNPKYNTAIKSPNEALGDEKLYVKGGQSSIAVINLFDTAQLDKMRTERWLINEANLVFNVDTENTDFKKSHEPERLYLYDYTNNTTILDYVFGTPTTNKNNSKYVYGGIIKRDVTTEKRGVSYTFNIINHIRNLLKNTSTTNVKLGLAVTEDINIAEMYRLEISENSKVPKASVMSPLGTILYGSNTSDENKKIKLEISYTKPK